MDKAMDLCIFLLFVLDLLFFLLTTFEFIKEYEFLYYIYADYQRPQ